MRSPTFLLLFFTVFTVSAQKTNFYAKTDARKILEGSYLQVDFILENAKAGNFLPPKFNNFTVVSGPSKRSSTSIVNGYRTQSISYSYGLQAAKAGTYTIRPATINANGKNLKTLPITIEVIKGKGTKVDLDKQVFVTLEVSDSTVQTGQQILVSYKLHTIYNVSGLGLNKSLNYDGFFAEEIQLRRKQFSREIIDGVEYDTKIIYKTALFPQQTGTYKIEPIDLNVQIDPNPANRGRQQSIFARRKSINKRIVSNGITIRVNPLPTSPEHFSGAVGKYNMWANSKKRSITTDDALVIQMSIKGNGDSKTVTAPTFTLPEGLEMYDPNTIEDKVNLTNNGWIHNKSFEYLIVANQPGRYKIQPSFTYFDSDSSKYVTLKKDLTVQILKGSGKAKTEDLTVVTEIHDIYSQTKLKTNTTQIYNSIWHWLLLSGLIFTGIGMYSYSRYLQTSGKRDKTYIRKNQAFEVAVERMSKSKTLLEKNEKSAFYEEITLAVKNYLTDKYNIPALHLKKTEIYTQLQEHKIEASIIENIKVLIENSELALYAPKSNSDMQAAYDSAVNLISELEK